MDREQKKLLLVAVSVGVFLLVTITAALIILTPKAKAEELASPSPRPSTPSIIQPVSNANIPSQPAPDNPQAANINPSMENSEPAAAGRNGTAHNNNEVSQVTAPPLPYTGVPIPDITQPPTPSRTTANSAPAANPASTATQSPTNAPAQTAAPTTAAQPSAQRQAPTATPAPTANQTSAATSTTATRPTAATRQTAPTRTINDYWIQTGAYSAIVRAEDAKELLASKGFISIIETRVIDGRNLYRVRLGPYTSEREANYWLSLVRAIDGFSDSQIRQTTRSQ